MGLYTCMRENNYNVLCLVQHLDDFAESFLMSAFRNGALRTMKANYYVEQHDLRVCRPLVNVREKIMAQFAKENHLPIIADNCPAYFAAPKERHRIKLMLSQQEFEHPDLFWSLMKSMKPLMSIAHTERSLDWWRRGGDDPDDDIASPVQKSAVAKEKSRPATTLATPVVQSPDQVTHLQPSTRTIATAALAGVAAGACVTWI